MGSARTRFVFLKDQSGDNVESGLEDKETEGRKADIIIPLGMERKRWIRKSGEDGQENLVDHWQWRVKICPVSVLCLSPRTELTAQGGRGRWLG